MLGTLGAGGEQGKRMRGKIRSLVEIGQRIRRHGLIVRQRAGLVKTLRLRAHAQTTETLALSAVPSFELKARSWHSRSPQAQLR
jgi:hypothetical protein